MTKFSHPKLICQIIFGINIILKIKLFVPKLIRDRISSRDNLRKISIKIKTIWKRLIMHCPFVNEVWPTITEHCPTSINNDSFLNIDRSNMEI